MLDPRLRTPVVDEWDGLTRLVRNRHKPARAKAEPQTSPLVGSPSDINGWLALLDSATPQGVIDALRELLMKLERISTVSLSFGRYLIVSIVRGGKLLGVLGISPAGDVDVPWQIAGEKDWFKPFAERFAEAVPDSILYESPKMWRVDGCGTARGQITIDELVGAATIVLDGVAQLAGNEASLLQ